MVKKASKAAIKKCARTADRKLKGKRGAKALAAWLDLFENCLDGMEVRTTRAQTKPLRGLGETSLVEEFMQAGEAALEKLRLKRRKAG